jgi:hypothetical protein
LARKQKKSEETSKASQKNGRSESSKRGVLLKKNLKEKAQTENSLSPSTIKEMKTAGKRADGSNKVPNMSLESKEYDISMRNSKIFSKLRQRRFREISSSENSSSTSKQMSLNSLSRGPRGGLSEEEEKKLIVDRFKKSQTLKRQLEEKIKQEVRSV